MDVYSGFNQMKIHPKDEEMIEFREPKGMFCYQVMPFSLKCKSHIPKSNDDHLQEILEDIVECYADNLVVKSPQKNGSLEISRGHIRLTTLTPTKDELNKMCFRNYLRQISGIHIRHRGHECFSNLSHDVNPSPDWWKRIQYSKAYLRPYQVLESIKTYLTKP